MVVAVAAATCACSAWRVAFRGVRQGRGWRARPRAEQRHAAALRGVPDAVVRAPRQVNWCAHDLLKK